MHEKKEKEEESKELEEIEKIMDVSIEKNKELLKKLAKVQKAKRFAGTDAPDFNRVWRGWGSEVELTA